MRHEVFCILAVALVAATACKVRSESAAKNIVGVGTGSNIEYVFWSATYRNTKISLPLACRAKCSVNQPFNEQALPTVGAMAHDCPLGSTQVTDHRASVPFLVDGAMASQGADEKVNWIELTAETGSKLDSLFDVPTTSIVTSATGVKTSVEANLSVVGANGVKATVTRRDAIQACVAQYGAAPKQAMSHSTQPPAPATSAPPTTTTQTSPRTVTPPAERRYAYLVSCSCSAKSSDYRVGYQHGYEVWGEPHFESCTRWKPEEAYGCASDL